MTFYQWYLSGYSCESALQRQATISCVSKQLRARRGACATDKVSQDAAAAVATRCPNVTRTRIALRSHTRTESEIIISWTLGNFYPQHVGWEIRLFEGKFVLWLPITIIATLSISRPRSAGLFPIAGRSRKYSTTGSKSKDWWRFVKTSGQSQLSSLNKHPWQPIHGGLEANCFHNVTTAWMRPKNALKQLGTWRRAIRNSMASLK